MPAQWIFELRYHQYMAAINGRENHSPLSLLTTSNMCSVCSSEKYEEREVNGDENRIYTSVMVSIRKKIFRRE